TNTAPADKTVICTMEYRTVDSNIALGTDFEGGREYTVRVNDVVETFTAQGGEASAKLDETVIVPAPIESVSISIGNESVLVVESGLPNSCYEFSDHALTRQGDAFILDVNNVRPSDESIMCAEIYRTVDTRIAIQGEIEPCKVYEVLANDRSMSIQAIAPNVRCASPAPQPAPSLVVAAPIESVEIIIAESFPPQYFLQIKSGLPNGCVQFDEYVVTRSDAEIDVKVTNTEPADKTVICTMEYRTVDSNIALGTDFEGGREYTVRVNDVVETFTAQGGEASGGPVTPTPPSSPGIPPYETVEVLAPIDSLKIDEQDGEYFALIDSGLPSGCASFHESGVLRDGTLISIKITNLQPAPGQLVACTAIYGTKSHRISLGRDLQEGATYKVVVNDGATETFTVSAKVSSGGSDIGDVIRSGQTVDVRYGTTLYLDHLGLELNIAEVLEDSRCPADVLCIWAGRARVLIGVTSQGEDLGRHELGLEGGSESSGAATIGDFEMRLVALDPYPGTTDGEIQRDEYTASLLISATETSSSGSADDFEIILAAVPVEGEPLTMRFTAELVGGADNSRELYCTSTTWEFGDGMGVAMMPSCFVWTPDVRVNRHLLQTHKYDKAGEYEVTLRLGPLPPETIVVEVKAESTTP
ncbi:MAG: PKD domain-containing protein, partial [Chloroflexi bacterium]|nr:PKD domain-containing protein [Chloroflexota bacterium]